MTPKTSVFGLTLPMVHKSYSTRLHARIIRIAAAFEIAKRVVEDIQRNE